MPELQPLLQLLGEAHWWPWLSALFTAMGGARFVLKPFNAALQAKLTAKMIEAANSPDAEEGADFDGLLKARWYRTMAFALDLIASVKLPTHADFLRAQPKKQIPQQEGTEKTEKQ